MMIYFGTSGFSYNDWVGNFYPPGMPRWEWLSYYAREFNTCELNSTFYALPKPSNLKAMVDKAGDGFLFSIKANQEMTHQRQDNADVFKAFRQVLAPIIDAGELGCILAQFPYSFSFNRLNWDYLASFREQLAGLPLVIEFRNAQWLRSDVFDWLRCQDLGFCCVDEPQLPNLLPPLAEATSKIGYVRFHGRNSAKWWQHEQAYERYDYSYSPQELSQWLPKIQKLDSMAEKTFIFANNHWRGQSVDTIRQLRTMLD
ncbi:MAG: DUF72 domain-containing protein [Dehalococcoidia bacterium]|nr:MAG: DUF72 domain-containing protein [Dehalococcoidia bacterium]